MRSFQINRSLLALSFFGIAVSLARCKRTSLPTLSIPAWVLLRTERHRNQKICRSERMRM